MWEKEKMLVTTISFSHNIFNPVKDKNIARKGEVAWTSNFSFSHIVFYPVGEVSVIIEFKIVVWKVFQFGRV